VTLEGWIFMVGLRVFDVGALVVWLVWFYRLKDDDDDADGEDGPGHGGGGEDPRPPDAPVGGVPLPDADPWPNRRRDHTGERRGAPARRAPAHAPERAPAAPHR
jgi:hypothetical protein